MHHQPRVEDFGGDYTALRHAIFRQGEIDRARHMTRLGGWIFLHRRTLAFWARLPILLALCYVLPVLIPFWLGLAIFCGVHQLDTIKRIGVMPHDP